LPQTAEQQRAAESGRLISSSIKSDRSDLTINAACAADTATRVSWHRWSRQLDPRPWLRLRPRYSQGHANCFVSPERRIVASYFQLVPFTSHAGRGTGHSATLIKHGPEWKRC